MTSKLQKARLALAERVLDEMEIERMKPLADKKGRQHGGRGFAQLDTVDRMKAQHQKRMEKLRKNNSRA